MQKEMNIPLTIKEMGTISEDEYFAAIDKMANLTFYPSGKMDFIMHQYTEYKTRFVQEQEIIHIILRSLH